MVSCKPKSGISDKVALAKFIEIEPTLLNVEMSAFTVEAKIVKLKMFTASLGPFQTSSTISD